MKKEKELLTLILITLTDQLVLQFLVISQKYMEKKVSKKLSLKFNGSARQSFGCWNAKNLNLILNGDANDYVGKGMNGGRIIIKNDADFALKNNTVLAGNTCLYGATGGELYISGSVGERFAVNSGVMLLLKVLEIIVVNI